jgi:adenine specific DNA methylase Mod
MNQLYYGDNLQVLREQITDESVDLIYLDPPFNSKRDYNLLFKSPKGVTSEAQIEAFEDTWHWNEQAKREFDELLHQAEHERGRYDARLARLSRRERHDGVPHDDG